MVVHGGRRFQENRSAKVESASLKQKIVERNRDGNEKNDTKC